MFAEGGGQGPAEEDAEEDAVEDVEYSYTVGGELKDAERVSQLRHEGMCEDKPIRWLYQVHDKAHVTGEEDLEKQTSKLCAIAILIYISLPSVETSQNPGHYYFENSGRFSGSV